MSSKIKTVATTAGAVIGGTVVLAAVGSWSTVWWSVVGLVAPRTAQRIAANSPQIRKDQRWR